jgi:hypothetical protein
MRVPVLGGNLKLLDDSPPWAFPWSVTSLGIPKVPDPYTPWRGRDLGFTAGAPEILRGMPFIFFLLRAPPTNWVRRRIAFCVFTPPPYLVDCCNSDALLGDSLLCSCRLAIAERRDPPSADRSPGLEGRTTSTNALPRGPAWRAFDGSNPGRVRLSSSDTGDLGSTQRGVAPGLRRRDKSYTSFLPTVFRGERAGGVSPSLGGRCLAPPLITRPPRATGRSPSSRRWLVPPGTRRSSRCRGCVGTYRRDYDPRCRENPDRWWDLPSPVRVACPGRGDTPKIKHLPWCHLMQKHSSSKSSGVRSLSFTAYPLLPG